MNQIDNKNVGKAAQCAPGAGGHVEIQLDKLDMKELRRVWEIAFGWKPPATFKRPFMLANLQYYQQVQTYGGLSKQTIKRIEFLAKRFDENPHYRPTNAICEYAPGTRLMREYKGQTYEVIVAPKGYRFEGKIFKSLSSIATKITGVSWNGRKFFGLTHGSAR